jgi:hypothetical protein
VNGYQIDLNQASRQEIFRLPNGKLIQVRKQTNPTPTTPRLSVPTNTLNSALTGVMPRGTQFSIRPTSVVPNMTTQSRMMRPQAQAMPRIRAPAQQRFSFSDGRVVSGGQGTASNAQTGNASTIFTQQNGSISVARAPQPDTPFGKAKTGFEDRIIQGLEICQHTINKMITLTNSTSFKTSRSFADLKDLYIHLQYLFTYTSGKFKTLQEGLVTGMEELAKHDANLREKNGEEEDDLEFVQQKVDIIEVLSDDEEEPVKQQRTTKKPEPGTKTPGPKSKTQSIELTTDETMDDEADLAASFLETILETPSSPVAQTVSHPEDLIASLNVEIDDEKVRKRTVVKVERLEDSKSSVIKQYLIAIQQRRETEDNEESESESAEREGSPEMPLVPEVVLEEKQKEGSDGETSKVDEAESAVEKSGELEDKIEENKSDDGAAEVHDDNKETEPVAVEDNANEEDTESSVLVEIPSDNEEAETPADVTKIDSTLPVDLMEVDDSVNEVSEILDDSVKEITEILDDSVNEVSEILDSNMENQIIQPKTNGVESPKVVEAEANEISLDESEIAEKEVPLENGVDHIENGDPTENGIDHENGVSDENNEPNMQAPVMKAVASETTIDEEKDLLDTLINSLDEPLAPMDVEVPEAMS